VSFPGAFLMLNNTPVKALAREEEPDKPQALLLLLLCVSIPLQLFPKLGHWHVAASSVTW